MQSAPSFKIVKKLKLVGEPYKIFKHTAFVKKMFNSDLEVAKFSHGKLQTVSGVRGEPHQLYNPMIDDGAWRRMKTVAELRREQSVPIPHNKDSEYGAKPERRVRKFAPLRIPKALEKKLPFGSKTKQKKQAKGTGLKKQRAIVRSETEKQVDGLLGRLNLIRKEKATKAKETKAKEAACDRPIR